MNRHFQLHLRYLFVRFLASLVLSLNLLLYGCATPILQVEGQFNLIHRPTGPLENIGFIKNQRHNMENVLVISPTGMIPRRGTTIEQTRESSREALDEIIEGGKEGGRKGGGLASDIFCESHRDEDEASDLISELFGTFILCPTMAVSGALVGGLGGAVLGPINLTSEEGFLPAPRVIKDAIVRDKVVQKIWEQLISLTSKASSQQKDGIGTIRFGASPQPTNFIKIRPTQIGLFRHSEQDLTSLTLEMRFSVIFTGNDQSVWAVQEVEAQVGRYAYREWIEHNAQLVKDSLKQGYVVIAQQILDDLHQNVALPKTVDPISKDEPPLPTS